MKRLTVVDIIQNEKMCDIITENIFNGDREKAILILDNVQECVLSNKDNQYSIKYVIPDSPFIFKMMHINLYIAHDNTNETLVDIQLVNMVNNRVISSMCKVVDNKCRIRHCNADRETLFKLTDWVRGIEGSNKDNDVDKYQIPPIISYDDYIPECKYTKSVEYVELGSVVEVYYTCKYSDGLCAKRGSVKDVGNGALTLTDSYGLEIKIDSSLIQIIQYLKSPCTTASGLVATERYTDKTIVGVIRKVEINGMNDIYTTNPNLNMRDYAMVKDDIGKAIDIEVTFDNLDWYNANRK